MEANNIVNKRTSERGVKKKNRGDMTENAGEGYNFFLDCEQRIPEGGRCSEA